MPNERQIRSRKLSNELVDNLGSLSPEERAYVTRYAKAGEWEQVGVEALVFAMKNDRALPNELVRQALDDWPNDMGGLAELFRSRIRTFDDSTVAA